jgi:hypothetical protein
LQLDEEQPLNVLVKTKAGPSRISIAYERVPPVSGEEVEDPVSQESVDIHREGGNVITDDSDLILYRLLGFSTIVGPSRL